jgi:hypothetical protein
MQTGDTYQKVEEGYIIGVEKPNPINRWKPLKYFNYKNVKVKIYCTKHKKQ